MSEQIKLSTHIKIPSSEHKIKCDSKILTIGSCFSNHVGNRLVDHCFNGLINPFGTIFNPLSMMKVLKMAMDKKVIKEDDLENKGNGFFHYDFHSSFNAIDLHQICEDINNAILQTEEYLKNTDFLVFTFGTSIVYKLITTNRIVSNCHKVSNRHFVKEILTPDCMETEVVKLLRSIKLINPGIHIILTVSPVRHIKEGLITNSLSKSQLVELCHRLVNGENGTSYFPAYEIMMDELRDYRFYKSDLIHPSELAVDIIWSYFQKTYFDQKAVSKVTDIERLIQAKNHIPFDPISAEYQKFKHNQLTKIEQLKIEYPEIDFSEFQAYFATS